MYGEPVQSENRVIAYVHRPTNAAAPGWFTAATSITRCLESTELTSWKRRVKIDELHNFLSLRRFVANRQESTEQINYLRDAQKERTAWKRTCPEEQSEDPYNAKHYLYVLFRKPWKQHDSRPMSTPHHRSYPAFFRAAQWVFCSKLASLLMIFKKYLLSSSRQ